MYSDEVDFVVYPNQGALVAALDAGSIDATTAVQTDTALPATVSDDFTVTSVSTSNTVTLYRQKSEPTLADTVFSGIISDFIDKKSIIATVEHGYGTLAYGDNGTAASFDDTVAKLEKAGFTYAHGSLSRNGKPVGFSVAVENDIHMLGAAQAVALDLGRLGIIVSIRAFDPGTFQNGVSSGEYSSIITTPADTVIPSTYQNAMTLYTKTTPVIIRRSLHGVFPETWNSAAQAFSTLPSWYSETDRLWKWIANIVH